MPVISIINQKGGCGKTTTAINLTSALALNNRKVLLLDLDPQAHASLGLNIESQESIYNVISKLTPRKLNIEDIIKRVQDSFDLIPSSILVGTLEQELADEIGREIKLTEVLEPIRNRYDYIIIDCPPSLGFLSVNALRASDEVIVPVEPSRYSLQGLDRLMDIVNLIQDRLNHTLNCHVLVTMFDSRLKYSFVMLDKIKERFSNILFGTIIHVNVKLKESALSGESVSSYDKYCRGTKDYLSLSKELMTMLKDAPSISFKPLSRTMRKVVAQEIQEIQEAQGVQEFKVSQEVREEVSPAQESQGSAETTTFVLDAPDAQSVYVTGSFNEWSLDETYRMRKEGREWHLSIPLTPGSYRYRFIVDGKWLEDPNNQLKERNPFGDLNSLLEVK